LVARTQATGGSRPRVSTRAWVKPAVTQGLANEIHFWVNPAVWGSGDRAFHGRRARMEQITTTTFDSGITLLCYRPAPDQQASATP
jgi:hypothetical protein